MSESYEIYKKAVGGLIFDGKPMLEFKDLPEKIRSAWSKIDKLLPQLAGKNEKCACCEKLLIPDSYVDRLNSHGFCDDCSYNIGESIYKNGSYQM